MKKHISKVKNWFVRKHMKMWKHPHSKFTSTMSLADLQSCLDPSYRLWLPTSLIHIYYEIYALNILKPFRLKCQIFKEHATILTYGQSFWLFFVWFLIFFVRHNTNLRSPQLHLYHFNDLKLHLSYLTKYLLIPFCLFVNIRKHFKVPNT